MVEEEERLIGRPGLRLRGFRRPRPRPRFRPPSRLRPHLQDNEEKELEEMMAALGENSPLKAEFEKFMKEQLGGGTGPRRLAQLGSGQFQSCVWMDSSKFLLPTFIVETTDNATKLDLTMYSSQTFEAPDNPYHPVEHLDIMCHSMKHRSDLIC